MNNEDRFLKLVEQKMPWLFIRGQLSQPLPEKAKEWKSVWDEALLNSDKNVQWSVATGDDSITNAGNKAPKSTTNK